MDGGDENPHGTTTILDGEWAGWKYWAGDPFETQSGPYYWREEADGTTRCAFRAERKHMNGGGFMHGGCVMTFADFALFSIATSHLRDQHGVTLTLSGEYIGTAHEGDLIECTGEVLKAGKSTIFVRGLIFTGDNPMMSFSGVIKKVGRRL